MKWWDHLIALSRWLLSMFEEKRDNGKRRLSMVRVAVAVFTVAYVDHLHDLRGDLGWPDAWLAFCVLFAVGIGKALDRASPDTVVEAVLAAVGNDQALSGYGMYGGPSLGYERPSALATDGSPEFEGEGDEL